MPQLKKVVDPFGEVNVYPEHGRLRVVATILMEPQKEGTQTGIALDGSGSMSALYGTGGGGALSSVFSRKQPENQITPVAQKICAHLARKLDADGGTTVIYWAVGQAGGKVEVVGDLTADQAEKQVFGPPKQFGTGTQLLPAVRYFTDRFKDAPYGFYVFITDGELHDLEDVKAYSRQLAREVASKKRFPLKFVLIGIGDSVNESQMEELDDLDTGTNVDLWDHKLARELTRLEQIFAEVLDENAKVADRGKIVDPQGRTVVDYSDTGVPAKLTFEIPAGTSYFTLEVNGNRIHQALSDSVTAPASVISSAPTKAGLATAAAPKYGHNINELDEVVPVVPVDISSPLGKDAPKPDLDALPTGDAEKKDDDWLGFDLKFEPGKEPPGFDITKDK